MNKIVRNAAVAGLAAWMTFSAGALPVLAAENAKKDGAKCLQNRPPMVKHLKGFGPDLAIHEQAYLSYLVKEYAPDTKGQWEKAFASRKAAMEKFIAKKAAQQEKKEAKKISKQNKNRVEEKRKELTEEQRKQLEAKFKERRDFGHQFAQAVEKHDSKAIQDILPKLLADYKKATELMEKMQETLKDK